VSRRGGLGWLLAAAARLLPRGRREWGTAMQAELAGIEAGRERWRFALGCLRVLSTQPAALGLVAYPLLTAAVLAAAARVTSGIRYAPLRSGLGGLVLTLVVSAWLGHLAAPLRPSGRAAWWVRAGGYALVAILTLAVARSMVYKDNVVEEARVGVPVFTVVLTGYLLGFLALTARRTAARGRVLAIGAGTGTAAAALFAVGALALAPIPPDVTPAVGLVLIAMLGAVYATGRNRGKQALLGALGAATFAALSVFTFVSVLSTVGPARLIPDLAPAALTPADDLAQRRAEIVDPYLWVLLLGWIVAIVQCGTALASRQRIATEPDVVARTSPNT
jgi:hypothetical protein